MLRGIVKALFVSRAWILSIGFLAAVWAVVESSQPFQACVKEQYPHNTSENFEKSISSFSVAFNVYRVCLGQFTQDNAEAIIAAFTILLALSTIFLWVATRDLVTGAEKTAKAQLRAYISIEEACRQGNHTSFPRFYVKFKNCGQTPAYNGRYWMDVQVREVPLVSILVRPEGEAIYRFEMPPGNAFTASKVFHEKNASISAEQANTFDKGEIAFFIFGQLDFDDAFGKSRWLKFRLRYGAECIGNGILVIEEIASN